MASALQYSSGTRILSGGYGRKANGAPSYTCGSGTTGANCYRRLCDRVEIIDGTCGPLTYASNFVDANDTDSATRTYTWRDSDAARNSKSSGGWITITDSWVSVVNPDNSITVTVTTTVNGIKRGDIRGGYGDRTIAIFDGADTNNNHPLWVGKSENIAISQGTLYSGGASVVHTYTIYPQKTTQAYYAIRLKNWVTGSANINSGPSIFVDEMAMGLVFKNNLPNDFDPPQFVKLDQTPHICDNNVVGEATFEAPNLNGGHIEFWWGYAPGDWSERRMLTVEATHDAQVVIPNITPIMPSQCEPQPIYWRARFVPDVDTLQPSEWSYGEDTARFVPPVWMSVPDITVEECTAVGKGDPLDEFTDIVYYGGEKPPCKEGKC